ncbi:MAG: hypothetical protein CMH12_03240 [Maritimibacter sp.]|nr:hypothetical protein [Maritimibacter sp.]
MTAAVHDKSCFAAVRVQAELGCDRLRTAAAILRRHGWPDTADDVMRAVEQVRFITNANGLLDMLERADPWPEGLG